MEKHPQSFDVCIVCALAEEARALLDVVSEQCHATFISRTSPRYGYDYRTTTIQNNQGEPLMLHVSWLPRIGPQETILHLSHVLEEYQPRFVAMTGICAGDRLRVSLGDLVVADRLYTYDSGKFVTDEQGRTVHDHDVMTYQLDENILRFISQFDQWKPLVKQLNRPPSKRQQREWLLNRLLLEQTPSVQQLLQQELERHTPDWRRIIHELQQGSDPLLTSALVLRESSRIEQLRYGLDPFPYTDPPEARCHIKPMASGSAVRSDNPFRDIQIPVRGTVAVEMEGASFGRVMESFPGLRWLVIKGVSDYADSEKDDSYHQYASTASALYLLCFLREYVTNERLPRLEVVRGIQKVIKERQQAPEPAIGLPLNPGRRRIIIVALATVATVATGIIGVTFLWKPFNSHLLLYTYQNHTDSINTVAWSVDSARIASGSDDKTVQVWDAINGGHAYTYRGHSATVQAVAWSPDDTKIASSSGDTTVQVWDARRGDLIFKYTQHQALVHTVAWSPDGTYIASGSRDGTLQVWEAIDGHYGQTIATYNGLPGKVVLAWSPDGNQIALTSSDSVAILDWRHWQNKQPYEYKGHNSTVNRVAWSPNGTYIASASDDQTAQVWKAINAEQVYTYRGHSQEVLAVAWSPDSRRIASTGSDNTVQIWNAIDGGNASMYGGHSAPVLAVAWSPDGQKITSGSSDKTVRVWQAP